MAPFFGSTGDHASFTGVANGRASRASLLTLLLGRLRRPSVVIGSLGSAPGTPRAPGRSNTRSNDGRLLEKGGARGAGRRRPRCVAARREKPRLLPPVRAENPCSDSRSSEGPRARTLRIHKHKRVNTHAWAVRQNMVSVESAAAYQSSEPSVAQPPQRGIPRPPPPAARPVAKHVRGHKATNAAEATAAVAAAVTVAGD